MPHLCDLFLIAIMGWLTTPRVSLHLNPLVVMAIVWCTQ